jgi:UMF1 family MFS transporter|tara:strand:- start:250 stop:1509 length:1260 start_codon:yes stop_codon:yes gene_type:complete
MHYLKRKRVISWALYDWANSAFATTVMAGFFPLFFKSFWAADLSPAESTAVIGTTNSLAGLLIVLLAPFLGAYSDLGKFKKKFLAFFALLGVLSTGYLYFIPQGDWVIAASLYALAVIGFSGGNIFYDSLIASVSKQDQRNKVSSLGFSLGYLGGGLLFVINVLMYLNPAWFGLSSQSEAILWSFVSVAVWWAVFSLPLFMSVEEKSNAEISKGLFETITEAFKAVASTLREIKKHKRVAIFLIAYWLYIDGVDTIVRMAVAYGSDIGLDASSMITALLLTQFVGFPATLVFGIYADKIGFKKILTIGISIYILVTFYAYYMSTALEFYILAGTVGLVQGGVQAISRSFFSTIIPVNKEAQFFGFYNLVGKSAVFLGPVLVSWVALIFGNPRFGILSLLFLLVPGLILLWMVPDKELAR